MFQVVGRWATNLLSGWRYRYLPQLVDWYVGVSVAQASKRLGDGPNLVLVDSSVLHHTVTHESAWIDTGIKLWGGQIPVETGYLARIPVHSSETDERVYNDVCYLAGIARLARTGRLKLMTSVELKVEQESHPPGRFRDIGMFDLNLFSGLQMECVDGRAWSEILSAWSQGGSLKDRQQRRLESSADPLFLGLRVALGKRNSQDAWHVATAERYGMLCFLTMDYRLIRSVSAQTGHPEVGRLKTKVLTPSQFGQLFGLLPVPPVWLSYSDASYPVRPDLSREGGRRRSQRQKASAAR